MRHRGFTALGKGLLPRMPGFAIKGSMIYASPVGCILRGLDFEGSSFDRNSFYATVFAMPLCVPTDHLYFNFGDRLQIANADRWDINSPSVHADLASAVEQQGVPFLRRAESLLGFVEVAKSKSSANPHTPARLHSPLPVPVVLTRRSPFSTACCRASTWRSRGSARSQAGHPRFGAAGFGPVRGAAAACGVGGGISP